MNEDLKKLYTIAQKNKRLVIGLMSGTSLDGLDVALCEISGNGLSTKLSLLKFTTVSYDADFRAAIKTVFSKKMADLEKLCLLNEEIGIKHAAIVNDSLIKWNISKEQIDLIASHGQTIYHAPLQSQHRVKRVNGTLQIGDGDHIAVGTGIITISDFRQKHIAAGGEGAPLAAYGDFILFSKEAENIILLNIGGISNFTFLPDGCTFDKMVCSDTGPGNTMMDTWMQKQFPGTFFDENAEVAKLGIVNQQLLSALNDHPFFKLPFPKTTGPELFNSGYLENAMEKSNSLHLSFADVMATLNYFTAETISDAINEILAKIKHGKIFISGGGVHNPLLMDHLKSRINNASIQSTAEINIPPDAKEAILFAILANECIVGNGNDFGKGTAHYPAISMGKISFPA